MKDFITISAKKLPFPGMDYEYLRKKGLTIIEKLAGQVWTDYNTHDPGITLLELLSYAITDLGYRTNFEIKDIIANEPKAGRISSKEFYTAGEILPCNPLSINDYRKLIIDIDGIKNAWLVVVKKPEVPFYADKQKQALSYTTFKSGETPIEINGLYNVIVEFSENEKLGDLNDNSVKKTLVFDGLDANTERLKGLSVSIDVNFPYWDNQAVNWKIPESMLQNAQSIQFKISNTTEDIKVTITQDTNTSFEVIVLDLKTLNPTDRLPVLEQYIRDKIDNAIRNNPRDSFISIYKKKIKKIDEIVRNVKEKLNEHRNLCEDFILFRSLKTEEIAICGSIDIKPEANTEAIQAEIYFRIEKFLTPDIRFYSLKELQERGKTTDQIFEGPLLDKGFIDNEELLLAQRRRTIHTSDIIKLIMDIEGIIAVRDIQLSNFPDETDTTLVSTTAKWCLKLSLDDFYTGRFSRELSKITFYKNRIPYFGDVQKTNGFYTEIKNKNKVNYPSVTDKDIQIPSGEYKNIADYYSIRHHLPVTYGIGEYGLSPSATKQRKAQAKQLRAFLLFFEQLLANYISQLAHVKDLFSMNTSVDSTYYSAHLKEVDDILVSPADYAADLKKIVESDEMFINRRNRFLDHLMARFGEQFTDYAILMYSLVGNQSQKELISNKLDFLKSYPEISRDRSRAFNYHDSTNIWNTSNVSGWEKRLCRLAGIKDYKRRNLTHLEANELFLIYKDNNGQWRFRLRNKQGKIILVSEAYTARHNCEKGIRSCTTNGTEKTNYKALTSVSNKPYFALIAQNHEIIGSSPVFKTTDERDKAIKDMISYCMPDGNTEGLHIVEHILLRPKFLNSEFLSVDLDSSCYCPGDEDPYSFRISMVLPGWTERFSDANFRNFFERTVRTEAPAHIMLRICWVSRQQMYLYENALHEWLSVNSEKIPDEAIWKEKLKELIEIMKQLKNIHPLVTLYDGTEIHGQNPVTLDNTVLGQINTQDNE